MGKALKQLNGEKMMKLIINSTAGDEGKADVILVHNFDALTIQRDQEVIVPERYVNVLKDAVIVTAMRDNDTGKELKDKDGNVRYTKIAQYGYSVEAA
jgi:hypothetical protein